MSVEEFRDGTDNGYLAWVAGHPEGYVINTKPSGRGYARLHRAACRTITSRPPFTGPSYIKVCSVSLEDATVSYYKFCTNGSGTAGELGIPTIGYGPGEEDQAHTVDESIALDDLHLGARGYAAIVSALVSRGAGQ